MLTHAWYLGVIEKIWRRLPRVLLHVNEKKAHYGIEAIIMDQVSVRLVISYLPEELVQTSLFARFFFANKAPDSVIEHGLRVVTTRYDDAEPYASQSPRTVFGGGVGIEPSSRL